MNCYCLNYVPEKRGTCPCSRITNEQKWNIEKRERDRHKKRDERQKETERKILRQKRETDWYKERQKDVKGKERHDT
jgi:hypothetical protein